MDHGRVAQVGTPRQIYAAPATRFVAGFVGTMNVVPGMVRAGELHFAGGRLPLDGVADGPAEAMFRPEDLQLVADAAQAQFSASVLASLFQGDHTRLELDVGTGRPLVARVALQRDFAPGERLALRLAGAALPTPAP
jgi:putative spermidine/putrescine transport system ATP-binding protein